MTTTTIDKSLLDASIKQINDNPMELSRAIARAYTNGWNAALASQPAKPLFAELIEQHEGLAEELAAMDGPAWHDAPTEPGLWVCQREDRHKSYRVADPAVWITAPEIGDRWCGPLPEDKP
jgi:hypothetical protein